MSRLLSELLGATEPMFSTALERLERASGNASVDVRLTAEIVGMTHLKGRALGLDPRDTTGRELYHALIGLAAKHDVFLAHRIGAKDPEDVADLMPKIIAAANDVKGPRETWALRSPVAKKLLKATPPKKTMKALGYRSLDSMLKRESVVDLYGAIRFLESPDWMNAFLKTYEKLQPSDFEMRKLEIKLLKGAKWQKAAEQHVRTHRHNVTHSKEMGAIYLMPLPVKRMKGVTITLLPLLLHYVNEIRMYSALFKMRQVRADFGKIIAETISEDPGNHAHLAGHHIHWRVMHRYFGRDESHYHAELFEPHIQPEDLAWRKAEETLYRMEPALHFWHDLDYVGVMSNNRPISFNLIDVAANYVNNVPYEHRIMYHLRKSLWNEILMRYMSQGALKSQIINQLREQAVVSEPVLFS